MSEKMQIRDRRTVRRFFVDNVILDKYGKKLGPYGIAVYMALCRFADQSTQSCFPSVQTIADRIGAGTTKVREMLRLLEKLGLIETQQRKDSSSIYTLLDPPCPDTPPQREALTPPNARRCLTILMLTINNNSNGVLLLPLAGMRRILRKILTISTRTSRRLWRP